MENLFNIENTNVLNKLPISVSTLCFRSLEGSNHLHTYTHLSFVLAGNASGSVNGREYSFPPGSCAVAAPYAIHSFDTRNSYDTPIVVHIRFKDTLLTEHGYRFTHYNKALWFEDCMLPDFVAFDEKNKTEARRIIREICNEFELKKDMSFPRIAEHLAEFFTLIRLEPTGESIPIYKSEIIDCITNAVKYIEAHFTEKITIDDVLPLTAMSRSVFTKHFKAVTGMTFTQFLTAVRLGRAMPKILVGNMSLNEIAAKTGLYNKTNLVRTFKKYFGMSPMRFHEYFEKCSPGIQERHRMYIHRWQWLKDTEENSSSQK